MQKRVLVPLFVLVLALTAVSLAVASDGGDPIGDCPDDFHLHMMDHPHGDHGEHKHVGNDRDRNGDDYICGKHVSQDGGVHVHIDNNIPLP